MSYHILHASPKLSNLGRLRRNLVTYLVKYFKTKFYGKALKFIIHA